jgi:hypothetical protein
MRGFPENVIFTACTGRCGQFSLVDYLNEFGESCAAEAEPPDLIYPRHWPLSNWLRDIQRKWIVTDEELGRGKALAWHDNDENEPLRHLAEKRLKRIQRLCQKNKTKHYFEASKFFIRSYCDATFELIPDMGVLLLRRDPLLNARSFCNRGKDFRLDGVMPDFRKACLPMEISSLSRFQLYLWQWVEIELRYQQFLDDHNVRRHLEFDTDDLNDPAKVEALFRHFSIELKKPLYVLEPKNTNVSKGREMTSVSVDDLAEFDRFIERLPAQTLAKLPFLSTYRQAHAEGQAAG